MKAIIVRYGEIALKSWPVQKRMLKQIIKNIKAMLKREGLKAKIEWTKGRIYVYTDFDAIKVLRKVFGITSVSPAFVVKADIEEIKRKALEIYRGQKFRITARRITKEFPYTSQQINEIVGEYIVEHGGKVDLKCYDQEIGIEICKGKAYIYDEKIKCYGGLPVGVSGKVVVLLSGGIDSAVAAWLIAKRGCEIVLVSFDFRSFNPNLRQKFELLRKKLKEWYPLKLTHYIVDFEQIVRQIVEIAGRYTCVLCKRSMLRIANKIAKRENALAIVTGENLAQVASQTLRNIYVINEASHLPILRPLLAYDKEEIISLAKEIGTYEYSIMPAECLAVPKKPITAAKLKRAKELEKKITLSYTYEKVKE